MCFGDDKSSGGGPQKAPRPVRRVPLSIESTSRVAVPAEARLPPRRPGNQTPQRTTTQGPVNTYKQPNPWPPELTLEYDNYKAADRSHSAARTRYRRERSRREQETNAPEWPMGRQTFAPMNLTPQSHYELRPMAVDWQDTAETHYVLRNDFNEAHPTAYDSPKDKEGHETKIRETKRSWRTARNMVEEHELYQGNFMQSDPYDYLDWATAASSRLPNGRRREVYNYDK